MMIASPRNFNFLSQPKSLLSTTALQRTFLRPLISSQVKTSRHQSNYNFSYKYFHTTSIMNSIDFKLPLSNGVKIPALGFGTFANEGVKGETHKAVVHALRAGYRHLDCAWFYQNEDEVGSGIREYMAEDPSLKREDLFICTKVWNHLHEPDEVEWSLKNSLEKLQTGYIDLFLIHWPIAAEKEDNNNVKIGADGKVRFLFLPFHLQIL